jgi:hypothetical protein
MYMPKRKYRPRATSMSPYFSAWKSHEETIADLKRLLAGKAVREMAGQLPKKGKPACSAAQNQRILRDRRKLYAVPAGKHPADAEIIAAYRGAGKRFRTRNELFWFLEERVESARRPAIEIRVRKLIKAGIITDFSEAGKP